MRFDLYSIQIQREMCIVLRGHRTSFTDQGTAAMKFVCQELWCERGQPKNQKPNFFGAYVMFLEMCIELVFNKRSHACCKVIRRQNIHTKGVRPAESIKSYEVVGQWCVERPQDFQYNKT